MWLLLFSTGVACAGYMLFNFKNLLFSPENKTFDDDDEETYEDDDYTLLCYKIKYNDSTETKVVSELTKTELDEIKNDDNVKYVICEYMFNGRLCKYIFYDKEVTFPIYKFNIQKTDWLYYPEYMWLGFTNITDYLRPFLGPAYNFYMDTEQEHYLKDILEDHPQFKNFDFEKDELTFVTNNTPVSGVKLIRKDPKTRLMFKRHAAVDPRDLDKLNLVLDENFEIVDQNTRKFV